METGDRPRSRATVALLAIALIAPLLLLLRGGGDLDGGPAPAAREGNDDAAGAGPKDVVVELVPEP